METWRVSTVAVVSSVHMVLEQVVHAEAVGTPVTKTGVHVVQAGKERRTARSSSHSWMLVMVAASGGQQHLS